MKTLMSHSKIIISVLVMLFLSTIINAQYLTRDDCKRLTNNDFKEKIHLISTPLNIGRGELVTPVKLILVKDYLLISDINAQKNVHILDIKENKYLGKFIDIGSQENQISSRKVFAKNDESSIIISDSYSNKYMVYEIDELLKEANPSINDTLQEKGNIYFLNYDQKNKKLFYAGSMDDNIHRLLEKDLISGNTKGYEETLQPSVLEYMDSIKVRNFISAGKVIRHKDQFVFAGETVPLLEVFDYKKKKLRSVVVPHHNLPIYSVRLEGQTMGDIGYTPDSLYEFLSIDITDKYIYALYRGQEFVNKDPKKSIVYVFDHLLNPVRMYSLDHEINAISINNDHTMYAIEGSPVIMGLEPNLLVYELEK